MYELFLLNKCKQSITSLSLLVGTKVVLVVWLGKCFTSESTVSQSCLEDESWIEPVLSIEDKVSGHRTMPLVP